MTITPDASVAVKWLLEEPDSEAALALLRAGQDFCGPALLRVEVAAALVRRYRSGGMDEAGTRETLVHAGRVLSEKRIRFVPDGELLARAAEIAVAIKHSLQDCLYLACAEREHAELVTADKTLYARANANFSFVRLL